MQLHLILLCLRSLSVWFCSETVSVGGTAGNGIVLIITIVAVFAALVLIAVVAGSMFLVYRPKAAQKAKGAAKTRLQVNNYEISKYCTGHMEFFDDESVAANYYSLPARSSMAFSEVDLSALPSLHAVPVDSYAAYDSLAPGHSVGFTPELTVVHAESKLDNWEYWKPIANPSPQGLIKRLGAGYEEYGYGEKDLAWADREAGEQFLPVLGHLSSVSSSAQAQGLNDKDSVNPGDTAELNNNATLSGWLKPKAEAKELDSVKSAETEAKKEEDSPNELTKAVPIAVAAKFADMLEEMDEAPYILPLASMTATTSAVKESETDESPYELATSVLGTMATKFAVKRMVEDDAGNDDEQRYAYAFVTPTVVKSRLSVTMEAKPIQGSHAKEHTIGETEPAASAFSDE